MCGIAGVLGGDDSAEPLIRQLEHRGPNGVRVAHGPNRSLAHARLSIIDLEGGWQPLSAAGSTIIGNGEIYNYIELARDFQLEGKLATGSDFEPLLHIYAQEGEAAFDRLRGMYAFCLIGADGRTWLVRDPFGIKPLYVHVADGVARFASEPRVFGAARADAEISRAVASLNYALSKETAWPGVYRLEPGEIAEFVEGELIKRRVRAAIPRPRAPINDEARALEALDAVLEDSVRVHQRSDVPYGLFLSGGIDSATIATLMARLNERPVIAYTCGFDAPGARDERAQAAAVARALNLDWRETLFSEEDFWAIAPQVAWALDDPVADYACLPTYKLAAAAKESLTVVLSGEGGDELFAGYGRYRRSLRPAWLGGRAAEPQVDGVLGGDALNAWRRHAKAPADLTPLQQAQWGDIATWLPNDLLLKLDRCLMAHGLEGRTPFLDREVAAFAFNLPDNLKVRGRFGKYLLRKWLERHCPAAEPWAKKRGFTVPVAAWIAPRAKELGAALADVEAVRAAADADTVRMIFTEEAHAERRWPLLFLGLWGRIHVEGVAAKDALKSLLA
ncbi:MAG TPA: asparagine synthase (glutamine-hydrolyzing) [Terricaulis sp.]|nr:asparagine synthase (glutamine-hydrolyzing) [Terricaulis sp.]